ncbi:GM10490 [Drosophila sechellia]|uniref:GM10490 n=1 Tax=Drosophila sechellia TaxID=7238 RepID=B4I4S1_DROSE|nr:GM10490 [Drosophila sechellia]
MFLESVPPRTISTKDNDTDTDTEVDVDASVTTNTSTASEITTRQHHEKRLRRNSFASCSSPRQR